MRFIALALLLSPLVFGANLGVKLYGKACVECHGDDGKETSIAPTAIAAQTGIYEKLTGYQNGTYGGAQKETMRTVVGSLSADQLRSVAEYVQTLR